MKSVFILKSGKGAYGVDHKQTTEGDIYQIPIPEPEKVELPNYTIDSLDNTLRLLRNGKVIGNVTLPSSGTGTTQTLKLESGALSISGGNTIALYEKDIEWETYNKSSQGLKIKIHYKRKRGIVSIVCFFYRFDAFNTLNDTIIFGLPEGFRPDLYDWQVMAFDVSEPSLTTSQPKKALIKIQTDGLIRIMTMDEIGIEYKFSTTFTI